MAGAGFKTVDEYIASQPEAVQGLLQHVRSTIRKAVPDAEELISYRIPAYRLHGNPVLYFAAWREHYSLYAATGHVGEAFKDELAPYEVNKGTIRFPISEPIPVKLIERIAKFRAQEAAERLKTAGGRARALPVKYAGTPLMMNKAEILQELDAIREDADRIMRLFENGRVPQAHVVHSQELFRALKEKLQAAYKRMATRKGEAALSEVEAHFYHSAINNAWANTGISGVRWNSRPGKDWHDALWSVSDYMGQWVSQLKGL